jgi:hypothetical protein
LYRKQTCNAIGLEEQVAVGHDVAGTQGRKGFVPGRGSPAFLIGSLLGIAEGVNGILPSARGNAADVADYCAKYVTKEGSWWNVKLLGQRHPAFNDFKLVGE